MLDCNPSVQGTSLLQSLTHEFGHSLGLLHSNNKQAMMAPYHRVSNSIQSHKWVTCYYRGGAQALDFTVMTLKQFRNCMGVGGTRRNKNSEENLDRFF